MVRILKKDPILSIVSGIAAPSNISYLWNFGSLLGICLVVQILTTESTQWSWRVGWLIRYLHANGASMFSIMVYLYIARGLYHGSYTTPRKLLWSIGVIIFLLMMGIAFIGYVFPWGQMSFWGATVITNMPSPVIPVIGNDLVQWVWGGFSVDDATLNRFYSFHWGGLRLHLLLKGDDLFPFLLAALVVLHLLTLHVDGSSNPLGISSSAYSAYYSYKDLFGAVLFLIFFQVFVFYFLAVVRHSDNYLEADPLVTPAHIITELGLNTSDVFISFGLRAYSYIWRELTTL